MSGLAGTLRERVVIRRRVNGAWAEVARAWASVVPEAEGASFVADARAGLPVWRMTLRPCPVAVGDRIERTQGTSEARAVRRDSRLPDRVVVIAEELR